MDKTEHNTERDIRLEAARGRLSAIRDMSRDLEDARRALRHPDAFPGVVREIDKILTVARWEYQGALAEASRLQWYADAGRPTVGLNGTTYVVDEDTEHGLMLRLRGGMPWEAFACPDPEARDVLDKGMTAPHAPWPHHERETMIDSFRNDYDNCVWGAEHAIQREKAWRNKEQP